MDTNSAESPSSINIYKQLKTESEVMLSYALKAGIPIPDEIHNLAILLCPEHEDPDSSRCSQELKILMKLHGFLTKTIKPATPASIVITSRKSGFFGIFSGPNLINFTVLISIVFTLGFIFTIANDSDLKNPWNKQFHYVFASGLGAAFYVLFEAHDYIKNRTFDPSYNGVYTLRFILGAIAGVIIANMDLGTSGKLSNGIIALLGGFSTEAVNQILKRFVDIMLAAVKGGGADVNKAKQEEVKAKATTELYDAKQSLKKGLTELLASEDVPKDVRDKLKNIHDKV